jgi:hypothetical protein
MVADSTVMSLGEIFSLILLLLVIANNLQQSIYAYHTARANRCPARINVSAETAKGSLKPNPKESPMQNIANKVVIITGASSGIGEATAYKLAREGAKIVLGARREDKLKAIADQIKADGGEAVYRVTDVVKPEDNAALVALAKETFGKVDVIFLNAGLMPSSPLSALETKN